MGRFERPRPIASSLLPQDLQRSLEPLVAPVSQSCDGIETDEEVIVIVNRIVKSKPGLVYPPSLSVEFSLQVEFRSPLYRVLDASGPSCTRKIGICRKRLPAIERPRLSTTRRSAIRRPVSSCRPTNRMPRSRDRRPRSRKEAASLRGCRSDIPRFSDTCCLERRILRRAWGTRSGKAGK